MRDTLPDLMIAVSALAAVIGAIAGLWNAYQYAAVLSGQVDEISRSLTAHLNAMGLH